MLILVDDINDNAPIFQPYPPSITLKENSPIGTKIVELFAVDVDEGTYGQVRTVKKYYLMLVYITERNSEFTNVFMCCNFLGYLSIRVRERTATRFVRIGDSGRKSYSTISR